MYNTFIHSNSYLLLAWPNLLWCPWHAIWSIFLFFKFITYSFWSPLALVLVISQTECWHAPHLVWLNLTTCLWVSIARLRRIFSPILSFRWIVTIHKQYQTVYGMKMHRLYGYFSGRSILFSSMSSRFCSLVHLYSTSMPITKF